MFLFLGGGKQIFNEKIYRRKSSENWGKNIKMDGFWWRLDLNGFDYVFFVEEWIIINYWWIMYLFILIQNLKEKFSRIKIQNNLNK